ncbi:MAG: complex I subunit 1 family protein, partial [Elusimicrobiota bacterium]
MTDPKPAPVKAPQPEPVLNRKNGTLMVGRRWPTDQWAHPWSLPGYRNGALMLAGIILTILAGGAVIGELSKWGDKLYVFMTSVAAAKGVSLFVVDCVWIAIKVLIVLHVILLNGLWAIWWERKISAHIQSRVGPTYAGGFHGWAQTICDGIKLFLKEDITPAAADRWVHALAPAIVIAPCIAAFAPVLFGTDLAAARLDVGTLYIFAFAGISVIGVVMAGWASGNKYSLLGGLRAAAQIVSYELPRGFSVEAGPLTHTSQNEPSPLTPVEEAILITCITGIVGITTHDGPLTKPNGTDELGTPFLNVLARTGSSADNAQATHFFMINDDGIFLLRHPTGDAALAALHARPRSWA